MAPCPSRHSNAICLNGRCGVVNDLQQFKGKNITLRFMRKNRPLKDKKVVLRSSHLVSKSACGDGLCQQPQIGLTLISNKAGLALLPIDLIGDIMESSGSRGSGRTWLEIEGLGEKDLDAGALLIDTQKVHVMEF